MVQEAGTVVVKEAGVTARYDAYLRSGESNDDSAATIIAVLWVDAVYDSVSKCE